MGDVVDHETLLRRLDEMAKAQSEAHERIEGKVDANAASIVVLDRKWTDKLDRIETKTDANTTAIDSAKGGLAVGKWIVGLGISVAGVIGLSEYFHK